MTPRRMDGKAPTKRVEKQQRRDESARDDGEDRREMPEEGGDVVVVAGVGDAGENDAENDEGKEGENDSEGKDAQDNDGGDGDDDDDNDDDDDDDDASESFLATIRNAPNISAEAERLELARTSEMEKAKLHADLFGLPPPGSLYRYRCDAERAADAVEAALVEIPTSERVAQLRAQIAFPFLLSSPSRVTPFLEAEDGDAARAARRIVRYWEGRRQLLGDDAFTPEAFGTDRNPPTDEDRGRLYRRGFKPTNDPQVDEALHSSVVQYLSSWLLGKIAAVEREIEALPANQTRALMEWKGRLSHPIKEEQFLSFLEPEDYDPKLAARRMASYWDVKHYLFGSEGLLDGDDDLEAIAAECREEIREGIVYNLPGRDAFGRGLVMLRADKSPATKAGQKRLLKVLWFCLKVALSGRSARWNGIVYVCYTGRSWRIPDLESMSRFTQLVFHSAPLRVCALHHCFPPGGRWFLSVFLPFLKWLLKRSGRMRLILHDYGRRDEMAAALEVFGMKKEQLPGIVGGSLDEDEYVRECMRLMTVGQSEREPTA